MALTLATAARTVMCDAVVDLLDVSGPGVLDIGTSSGFLTTNLLASITLSATAFGSASSGQATLSGTPLQDTSANNSGTAALFRLRTSGGTAIISGACKTSNDGSDITLDVSAQNAALAALNTLIGSGATLEIGTTGFASVLATLPLGSPAFGTPSAGAMAITGTPTVAAANAGTAAVFRIKQSGGTVVVDGTVGTSGADINFSNVVFGVGSTITISSYSITLPATTAGSSAVLVFASLAFTAGETIEVTSFTYNQPA